MAVIRQETLRILDCNLREMLTQLSRRLRENGELTPGWVLKAAFERSAKEPKS